VASSLAAYLAYQGLAIVFFGIPVFRDFSHRYVATPGAIDPSGYMWFLVWWPYAIAHHLNPFISNRMWAPTGFNVTWAQSIPLPSLAAYPITRAYGPVVAWNVLCLVAPALASWSAFALCRYVSRSYLPSLVGGYIFGFSPYFLGQLRGHLSLVLVFPLPLALYVLLLRFDRRLSKSAFVALFSALVVVQFLCCDEVLASAVVLGGVVMLAALFTMRDQRARLYELGVLIAFALGAAAVVLSPFLYYALFAGFPRGPIYRPADFSSDLLGFFIPTKTVIGGNVPALMTITSRFLGGISEVTPYIGIGFLLLILDFSIATWRHPERRLITLALIIVAFASMGPRLHVAGITTLPLPWALFTYLPLIDKALPARFTMFVFLALGVMTAVYLVGEGHQARRWILATLGLALFLPNLSSCPWCSRVDTPRYFADGIFRRQLKQGEITLILPYGRKGNSMLWQAQSGMYFRMAGGWVPVTPPEFSRWPLLATLYSGEPGIDFDLQFRCFLAAHDVRAIILARNARRVWPRLLAPLGLPVTQTDGVFVYQVPERVLEVYHKMPVQAVIRRVAIDEFSALVNAANRYVSSGFPLAKLTPREAHRLGVLNLPPGSDERSDSPFPQWWQNLWLGSWGKSLIGVGIVGDYEDLQPLVQRYGADAAAVFFPFPKKLTRRREHGSGQLLVVFTPQGLERAAQVATRAPEETLGIEPAATAGALSVSHFK
jgi:hypothetical protein